MSSTADTPRPPSSNSRKRPAEMAASTPSKLRVPRSAVIKTKSQLVEVQCGSDGPIFKVHLETLLISPYFYHLFIDEKFDGVVRVGLPEEDSFLLEAYIHFLYTRGTLPTNTEEQSNTPATVREEIELLNLLHRFAYVTKHAEFYNATLDGIVEISRVKDQETGLHCLPDPAKISHFPWHSEAKRCFIDLYAHFMDPEDPVVDRPENQQFMREVLKATRRIAQGKREHGDHRGDELKRCDYHKHEEGVRCDDTDGE